MNKHLSQSAEELTNYAWQQAYYNYYPDSEDLPLSPRYHIRYMTQATPELTPENKYFVASSEEAIVSIAEKNYIDEDSPNHLGNPLFLASLPSDIFTKNPLYSNPASLEIFLKGSEPLPEAELIEPEPEQEQPAPPRTLSFRTLFAAFVSATFIFIAGYEKGYLSQKRRAPPAPSQDLQPFESDLLSSQDSLVFSAKNKTISSKIANSQLRKRY